MQLISLFVALIFAVFQAQGVAVPAKVLRDGKNNPVEPDITVKFKLANGTVVDTTPDSKSIQTNFEHTTTTQNLCVRGDQSTYLSATLVTICWLSTLSKGWRPNSDHS